MKKAEYYIIQREWTETLQGAELLLFAYITNTCKNCGICECSKAHLSYMTGVGERWLNKALQSLVNKGLLTIEQQAGKGSKYTANPYTKSVPLHLKCTPTLKVSETPAVEVYPHNIINNIIKKKEENSTREEEVFQKPTLQEVSDYIKELNTSIDPQRFIDYYEAKGWKVGGSQMSDWRATLRASWLPREKKQTNTLREQELARMAAIAEETRQRATEGPTEAEFSETRELMLIYADRKGIKH